MRFVQRVLLTMALAVSAFTLAPAGAANAVVFDCDEYEFNRSTIWLCRPMLFPKVEWDPEVCPDCLLSLDLEIYEIKPEIEDRILTGLLETLLSLDRAAFAKDPELAERYLRQAYESALATGEVMAEHEAWVKPGRVGAVDPESGKFYEESVPIVEAVGEHMAEGMNLLGGLAGKPDIDGAFAHFEQVNKLTAELHAGRRPPLSGLDAWDPTGTTSSPELREHYVRASAAAPSIVAGYQATTSTWTGATPRTGGASRGGAAISRDWGGRLGRVRRRPRRKRRRSVEAAARSGARALARPGVDEPLEQRGEGERLLLGEPGERFGDGAAAGAVHVVDQFSALGGEPDEDVPGVAGVRVAFDQAVGEQFAGEAAGARPVHVDRLGDLGDGQALPGVFEGVEVAEAGRVLGGDRSRLVPGGAPLEPAVLLVASDADQGPLDHVLGVALACVHVRHGTTVVS